MRMRFNLRLAKMTVLKVPMLSAGGNCFAFKLKNENENEIRVKPASGG